MFLSRNSMKSFIFLKKNNTSGPLRLSAESRYFKHPPASWLVICAKQYVLSKFLQYSQWQTFMAGVNPLTINWKGYGLMSSDKSSRQSYIFKGFCHKWTLHHVPRKFLCSLDFSFDITRHLQINLILFTAHTDLFHLNYRNNICWPNPVIWMVGALQKA